MGFLFKGSNMWILIVIILYSSAPFVKEIEFTSKKNCETAKKKMADAQIRSIKTILCVEK